MGVEPPPGECTPGETRPCGSSIGECAQGIAHCGVDAEWGPCLGAVGPFEEVCNGLDDDCDGTVDALVRGCGTACGEDEQRCDRGEWTACDAPAPTAEACNDIDDDCDGVVDEDPDADGCVLFYRDADGDGDGGGAPACLCAAEPPYVVEGGGDCDDGDPMIGPGAAERCDGVDDDCDGATDEDWPAHGEACDGDDADLCADGVMVCAADGRGLRCDDDDRGGASMERCNGRDDDCDGRVDEDWAADLGRACDDPGDAELCPDGRWVCRGDGAGLRCEEGPDAAELCNGRDDDCDGEADEEHPVGERCDEVIGLAGVCRQGEWACTPQGGTRCIQVNEPSAESCDGRDEDCDGDTDEDGPYPAPDDYEPNAVWVDAAPLPRRGDVYDADDANLHSPGDLDAYAIDFNPPRTPEQRYIICRMSELTGGVRMRVAYTMIGANDVPIPVPGEPGAFEVSLERGNGQWFRKRIDDQSGYGPISRIAVGIQAVRHPSGCHTGYRVQCKLTNNDAW